MKARVKAWRARPAAVRALPLGQLEALEVVADARRGHAVWTEPVIGRDRAEGRHEASHVVALAAVAVAAGQGRGWGKGQG